MAPCEWDDAECAMHVASLHSGNESSRLPFGEHMVSDGSLGIRFFVYVDDRKPDIVETRGPFPFDRLINVVRHAVKFLGSDNQIKVRQFVQQGRTAALRHASEQTVDDQAIAGE